MFEKDLRLILLFDIYGELLTETQRSIFDLYYNDDLSLSEVAENVGITRQGVRDSIKRTEEALRAYEEKLGLAERFIKTNKTAEEAAEKLIRLKEKHSEDAPLFDEVIKLLRAVKL